ncbi:hypothetical protein PAPYR_12498 [Paratrimastix pyriformis]|uniref:Uncharacterized protein n=1 Tax=Paratrimastix pyriformis TaxID=342808 RepID=A0ABQ8U1S1_9EUKA|nr:hypothetical protein PAPYR_12498 [Paratrimastix pyriformis]
MALFVVAWSPRHALEYSLLRDEGCVLEVLILCSFGPTGLIPHASNLCWTVCLIPLKEFIHWVYLTLRSKGLANQFDTLFYRPHGPCWAHQQTFSYRLTNQFDTLFYRPHGPCWAHQQTFSYSGLEDLGNAMLGVSLLPMSDTADPLSVFGSGLPEGKPPTSARTKAGGPMSTTIPVDPGADSWPRMICGHTGAVSAAQLAGFYNDAHCELLPTRASFDTLARHFLDRVRGVVSCVHRRLQERSFTYFGRAPGEQPTPRFRIGDARDTMTRYGLHVPHGSMAVATPCFGVQDRELPGHIGPTVEFSTSTIHTKVVHPLVAGKGAAPTAALTPKGPHRWGTGRSAPGFDTLLIRPHGAHSTCQQPMLDRLANQFDTLFYRPHGPCWAHQQTFSYRLTNQFDTLFYRPHGPCWAHQQTFSYSGLEDLGNAMLGVSLLPMSDTADPLSGLVVFGSGLPEGKPPTSARTKAGGPMSTTIPVDPGADSWPRMICGHTGAVSAAQLAGFYNDAHCELLPTRASFDTLARHFLDRVGGVVSCVHRRLQERSFTYFGRAPGEQPTPRFRIGDARDTMTRYGLHVPHGSMAAVATPCFRDEETCSKELVRLFLKSRIASFQDI